MRRESAVGGETRTLLDDPAVLASAGCVGEGLAPTRPARGVSETNQVMTMGMFPHTAPVRISSTVAPLAVAKHNSREMGTMAQMQLVARLMVGKRLR